MILYLVSLKYNKNMDCVTGDLIIKNNSMSKSPNYVINAELRWGTYPNKGGYKICLHIDNYEIFGDDNFSVERIESNGHNTIICHMSYPLMRCDDLFGTYNPILSLGSSDYNKVINNSNNIRVISLPPDTTDNNESTVEYNNELNDIKSNNELDNEPSSRFSWLGRLKFW